MGQQSVEGKASESKNKSPLHERLHHLKEACESTVRELTKARKAFDGLLKADGLSDLRNVEKRLAVLSGADLSGLTLEEHVKEAVTVLGEYLTRRKKAARMTLVGKLHRAAEEEGVEISRLADQPPTFLLAPVALELRFDRSDARVMYAREEVLTVELDAGQILAARRRAMELIRQHDLSSPEFFDLLRRAYDMVRAARGLGWGKRVDLVDLLLPLSLLAAETDAWRKLAPTRLAQFHRYQLAYHLQRLRRDQVLERDGVRLDLGTATGGSALKKRDVLFVPSRDGEGQYYLSLRFTP